MSSAQSCGLDDVEVARFDPKSAASPGGSAFEATFREGSGSRAAFLGESASRSTSLGDSTPYPPSIGVSASRPVEPHPAHPSVNPTVTSLQNLTIVEAWDSDADSDADSSYVTFYLVTSEEEVYFGESSKNMWEITLEEYASALQRIADDEIYPEVPEDIELTLAPETLDDNSAYIKRPGLSSYETKRGTGFVPRALLDETLIMDSISKSPHPNIVGYYGCRIRRGRITAIVLERLDKSLTQYASTSDFQNLDRDRFAGALESAVDHLHSLGLAHNDINPDNIMVKEGGVPVLIDFGSCQPFGKPLQFLGTDGWFEELFYRSEKRHDVYSLGKLRGWLQVQQSAIRPTSLTGSQTEVIE